MSAFIHIVPKKHFSQTGLLLLKSISQEVDYYKASGQYDDRCESSKKLNTSRNEFVPSKDNFIAHFTKLYMEDKEKPTQKQSLIVALAKVFTAKACGQCDPKLHDKLRNLCLVIHAYSPPTFGLISGNLDLLSERHICRENAKRKRSCYQRPWSRAGQVGCCADCCI